MNRIWVTRDEPSGGPLSQALTTVGLIPIHCPVVHRTQVGNASDELAQLGEDDWLVLTSAYAVDCLDPKRARVPRTACVGTSTDAHARSHGMRVELVNKDGDAAALWKALQQEAQSGIICHPRSTLAVSPPAWEGVTILSPIVYETMGIAFDRSIIERVDAAAVASASAAKSIGRVTLPLASIGPTTSRAIRDLGMEPWLEAPIPTFVSLAEAIAERRNGTTDEHG